MVEAPIPIKACSGVVSPSVRRRLPCTKKSKVNQEKRNWVRELAYHSSLGFSVPIAIFIGLGIGVYLDRRFETSPWLMLVFLGVGIAAGFRNIGHAIRKSRNL